MNEVEQHRALREDLRFSKKAYSRQSIRKFARDVGKDAGKHWIDCFTSDDTHYIVRLKFNTVEQKERLVPLLRENTKAWSKNKAPVE